MGVQSLLFCPIGSDHLSVVLLCLEDQELVARWQKIGIMLQLLYSDLDVIKQNPSR